MLPLDKFSNFYRKILLMNKSSFSSSKLISIALILLLILITVGAYFLLDRDTDESEISSGATHISPTAIDKMPSITQSPILTPVSVVSPISPINVESSPISNEDWNLFSKAEELFLAGDYLASVSAFSRLLEIDPKNEIALTYRGNAYIELGDYSKAIASYTEAINLNPDTYPQPYYNRGRAYMFLEEYDKALADLEKSIELDHYDDIDFAYRANGNIGLIYRKLGNYEKALDAFSQSISASNGTQADAFYLRGETYLEMGNYEAAIADYESAISRFPRYHLAYQSLGYAYYKTGQFDPASEALNQALAISSNSPQAHFYLGLLYLATDDIDQAQAEISQATTLSANIPPDEQASIYHRIIADLEIFAEEHSDKSEAVKSLIEMIPK